LHVNKVDLAILLSYMAITTVVGISFAKGEKETLDDFLLADRKANRFLIGVSIFSALFSAATYLGAPAEVFLHSFSYAFVLLGLIWATMVTAFVFLPRFLLPGVFSAYEILERKSSKAVRLIGSLAFILRSLLWLAIAVYAPALALEQLAGIPMHMALIANAVLATFYTTLGGMRGVIWTDLLQCVVLVGGQVTILLTVLLRIPGGFPAVLEIASRGNKFALSSSFNPHVRITIWGLLIGGGIGFLIQMATDQIAVQRYLSVRDVGEARQSLWVKLCISIPVVTVFYFTGVALYAFYRLHVDPLSTGEVRNADQILPYFVRHELPIGMPGLLAAALSSASMSAVSGGLNAMVTVTLTDIPASLGRWQSVSLNTKLRAARVLTVLYGLLVLGLSFVAERFGTLVQGTAAIIGIAGGPLLGVFVLALAPWRTRGWVMITAFCMGNGCVLAIAELTACSFLWYGPIGVFTTVLVGLSCHSLVASRDANVLIPPTQLRINKR
jgi:SSS family transporter